MEEHTSSAYLENAKHGRLPNVCGDVVERLMQRLLDVLQDGLQPQVAERAQGQAADQRVLVVTAAMPIKQLFFH